MKILIPNATGPTNPGDQAILLPIVHLIKSSYSNSYLTIHSTEPDKYKKILGEKLDSTLYFWAAFSDRNFFIRSYRILMLLLTYLLLKVKIDLVFDTQLKELISDYRNADLVVFIGGGYFRSQKGVTQSLNLIMLCTLFEFAKLFKAKKLVTPISFGPFAYIWQEKLCAHTLRGYDLVSTREDLSFKKLRKNNIKNLVKSSDTALFLTSKHAYFESKKFILGFTIRKWLNEKSQNVFEAEYTNALIRFANKTGASIQPIVQVNAPEYGDFDYSITQKIAKKLKKSKIKVLATKTVQDLESAKKIYSKISLLLGMRMHSNILAAVHGVPFVAISYEYKTEGISKDLGLEKYCITVANANHTLIYDTLITAYKKRGSLKKRLIRIVDKIASRGKMFWQHTFEKNTKVYN